MSHEKQVLIVMGSDSDLSVMKESAVALEEFNVSYSINVCSAHRQPRKTSSLAAEAEQNGVKVIIAGAGGAAHLPGVIASYTTLPVIGVPMRTSFSGGADSLHSIVQMPRGIPVATVAVNGAYNAGLLAVQFLSLSDENLAQELKQYRQKLSESVDKKNDLLQEKGYLEYLKDME